MWSSGPSPSVSSFQPGFAAVLTRLVGKSWFVALTLALALPRIASAQDTVVGWGGQAFSGLYHAETFTSVEAGEWNSMGIRADGSIAVWGLNYTGACNVPTFAPGLGVQHLAGGNGHVLALMSDGSIVAWGRGNEGQCNPPPLPPGVVYTKVAAGTLHSLALRSDGVVVAFGSNSNGQGTVPFGGTFTDIDAGGNVNVAVTSSGTLAAWGDNSSLVGNVPTPPPGASAVEVSVAPISSYIVRWSDGSLEMWGSQAPLCQVPIPTLPVGMSWLNIEALASRRFAGLRSDGQVITWSCTGPANNIPVVSLPPGLIYVDIAASGEHLVALRSDGKIVVMGRNRFSSSNIPELPAGVSYTQVDFNSFNGDFNGDFGLALSSDGQIHHWGFNTPAEDLTPPALPVGVGYTALAAGGGSGLVGGFAAAIRSNGTGLTWGYFSIPQPAALPIGMSYVAVAAGETVAYFLRSDGILLTSSVGIYGEQTVPALPPGTTYTKVAAATYSAMALRSDGAVKIWGENAWADGGIPVPPSGLSYTKIACGAYHYLALRSDGVVVATGDNSLDQFPLPPLPSGVTYVDIACGDYHTIARRSDGVVVSVGLNGHPGSTLWSVTVVPPLPSGYEYGAVFAGGIRNAALASPAAAVATYGLGCIGANGTTTIASVDVPFVGNPGFGIDLSGGASNAAAYLYYATAEALPPVPIAPGCRIYLDLASAQNFIDLGMAPLGPVFTNLAGGCTFSVALPGHPAFNGVSLYFQAAVLDLSVGTGLTLSNGLRADLN